MYGIVVVEADRVTVVVIADTLVTVLVTVPGTNVLVEVDVVTAPVVTVTGSGVDDTVEVNGITTTVVKMLEVVVAQRTDWGLPKTLEPCLRISLWCTV